MVTVQIFLSTVSAEFRRYRDALRHDLDRPNVTVKVQEDFITTGTETLDMLDGYIKRCDAVIHLVGDMTGALAQAPSVTAIRQRYPDFGKRLPVLSPFLQADGPALPYTQWEAWLALYHRKRLIVCAPEEGAPRDERYLVDQEQIAAQRAHLERLGKVERYPFRFANADRLAVEVLRSHLLDMLASAGRGQGAGEGLVDFAQERMRHGEIIGRELAIGTVRGWIDRASRGWALIKGGPGTGKSALLAAILNRLESEYGAESVPYHFLRRGQGNWNEPDAVVRNLIARLERIGTPSERSMARGLERLYALLVAVAAQRAAINRRLVLVVDGLDEAEVTSGVERVLGRFLPATLPDNVFILCASRPNYPELGWLEQRSGLRTIDLDRPPWLADNRSVVDAYWRKRGPQLKPPLGAELLEQAVDAAQGNMLHAVTLFDAFDTDTQVRDPHRIPVGFNALLEDLWVRLVEMKDRETSTRVIAGLGLLAVAEEALPLTALARLLEWNHPADVSDFKRCALPFLLEENADWHGGESRFRPFHESTREFLTSGDHMRPDVYRGYHERLARRLAAWPLADGSGQLERGYAARFALLHLSAIADWLRISEMLGDLHFCVAAVEALGPTVLLARISAFSTSGKPPQLIERANILQRVLRAESQGLETHPRELPNLIHNRLTCLGWSRDRIGASFSGFDRGWGLLNQIAMGDEICILRGHPSSVAVCDLDSHGRYGVSGGFDGNLRVWDLKRGTCLHVLRSNPEAVHRERRDIDSCAISSDGRYIAVALSLIEEEPRREYGRIEIWDTRDGALIRGIDHDAGESVWVAFATNEKAIACYGAGHIDVFDIERGTNERLTLDETIGAGFAVNASATRIAVNASGTLLAGITRDGCCVWKLSDGSKVSAVPLEDAQTCSFSPDDRSVAVSAKHRALVANAADGSVLYNTDAIGQISSCRLLDSTRLLFTSGYDGELVVWDMATDRPIARYQGHVGEATCCSVTPDGRLALTGGRDRTVRLWSLAETLSPAQVDRHAKPAHRCVVNAAATLACSAGEGVPVIWNARSGTCVLPIGASVTHALDVRFCRFEGRSRLATIGRSLQLFDPESAQLVWEAEIPDVPESHGPVRWIRDDGDDGGQLDRLPLIHTGSQVIIWQPTGALQQIQLPVSKTFGEETLVSSLNAGQAIAVLHDRVLEIIDLNRTDVRRTIAEGVKACVGSPRTHTVYAVMLDGQVCRLHAGSGKRLAVLGEIKQRTVSLRIDPQETALWALCANRGHPLAMQAPTDEMLIAFSPDASGMLQQASIAGHAINDTSFQSGMLVTAGGADATIRVWDARQPMPLAVISGSSLFVCVDAAGDRLVAGDGKGNVWFLAPMEELYR